MSSIGGPVLDDRDEMALVAEFRARRAGYLPQWNPPVDSAGAAIEQVFAHLVEAILKRLNQAPDKNRLAFFSFLGLDAAPAAEARAPIVFSLNPQAGVANAPAGTQVAAPPPPGATAPIVFEIERGLNISAAALTSAATLWPGRDEYVDHTTALASHQPFTLFDHTLAQGTPHELYLSHPVLLALSGAATVLVEVHLTQGSDARLPLDWQYWDGQVWRAFDPLQPTCLDAASQLNDGTAGFTTSGSVTLTSGCAHAQAVAVNGVSSFWIRARLAATLPVDPARILPVVEALRVRTMIVQDLSIGLQSASTSQIAAVAAVEALARVREQHGSLLVVDNVTLTATDSSGSLVTFTPRDGTGILKTDDTPEGGVEYAMSVSFLGMPPSNPSAVTKIVWPNDTTLTTTLDVVAKIDAMAPDKAMVGQSAVDVSKSFFPFGGQPRPGAAFYFTQKEVFAKPKAIARVFVERADSPQSSFTASSNSQLPRTVVWEYWNGTDWFPLGVSVDRVASWQAAGADPIDLTATGCVVFQVPEDMVATQVANQEALWIRVRLVSGGFGFFVDTTVPTTTGSITVQYVVPQPPVLADFRIGFSWQNGPEPFDRVFSYNDFGFEDRTENARWPGAPFTPFSAVADRTPAFYLGTDAALPSADAGLYFDIVEAAAASAASPLPLVWEEWDGGGWRQLTFDDDTEELTLPGIVALQPLPATAALMRFGRSLYWIRARLIDDQPPTETTVGGVVLNAVWASQQRTFQGMALGASTGAPSQVFTITQVPVLAEERIEVREFSGRRANVEWRIVALQLFDNDAAVVEALENALGAEGVATDVQRGDLRLVRDRTKNVVELWVRWSAVPHFYDSGPLDRHYVLDRASGRLLFGDGVSGMLLPLGAVVQATQFRSGGGSVGCVPAGAIKQLLGSVPGVQSVTNPRAAEGGADGETPASFGLRAPDRLRARGRAVTAGDYEALAREASASVAFARAIPGQDQTGRRRPGWITLLIMPNSQDPQPVPSFGLREEVRAYLEAHAPMNVASAGQIVVTTPGFFPIDVSATLAAESGADAGAVLLLATDALNAFLHPLTGGPDGQGWGLGRDVYLSDIAAVLAGVPGVDAIRVLSLLVGGVPQSDHVAVGSLQIVVAGSFQLTMVED